MKKILTTLLLLTFCTVQAWAGDVIIIGSDGQARYEKELNQINPQTIISNKQNELNQNINRNDTYYLTPTQEEIAWNEWRANLSNYIGRNFTIPNKYLIGIQFSVNADGKLPKICITRMLKKDYGKALIPTYVYGDVTINNVVEPISMYIIYMKPGQDYDTDKETVKKISVSDVKDSKMMVTLYEQVKKMEGAKILEFPQGTRRTSVDFSVSGGSVNSLESAYKFTESDFNDIEKVTY